MKKETILLLGAAGVGAYLLYKSKQGKNKNVYSAPGKTTQQQQTAIKAAFQNILPNKKKLIPKIIVPPVQSITEAEYNAGKTKTGVLQKAGTLIKKLFAKKKVSGLDSCNGLF